MHNNARNISTAMWFDVLLDKIYRVSSEIAKKKYANITIEKKIIKYEYSYIYNL